jgi:hypothetical protein
VREPDERLGFGELITQQVSDSRRGKNTQLPVADLLAKVEFHFGELFPRVGFIVTNQFRG